jgi:hypothetical protein
LCSVPGEFHVSNSARSTRLANFSQKLYPAALIEPSRTVEGVFLTVLESYAGGWRPESEGSLRSILTAAKSYPDQVPVRQLVSAASQLPVLPVDDRSLLVELFPEPWLSLAMLTRSDLSDEEQLTLVALLDAEHATWLYGDVAALRHLSQDALCELVVAFPGPTGFEVFVLFEDEQSLKSVLLRLSFLARQNPQLVAGSKDGPSPLGPRSALLKLVAARDDLDPSLLLELPADLLSHLDTTPARLAASALSDLLGDDPSLWVRLAELSTSASASSLTAREVLDELLADQA